MKLSNPVLGRSILGAQLAIIMHNRLGGIVMTEKGPTTMLTKSIRDWLHSEASYCLDAPEKMPGGSCYNVVSDTPKGRFESFYQTEIKRENI